MIDNREFRTATAMDAVSGVVVGCKGNRSSEITGGGGKVIPEIVTEFVLTEGAKASYASKVIGDKAKDNKTYPLFFGEEVIVCDEDAIIDQTTLIPSIRFFYRVHDQVDHSMQNAINVRLLIR
ncbi:hypothetical protein GQ457_07G003550 [Hibiscus cannabinus]